MTLNPKNTNVTTAGAGTLLAAALLGGFITRTGPGGAVNDTLDSTANILAALGQGANPQTPFVCRYYNTTAYTLTLVAGDASTTITALGASSAGILTHQVAELLFTPTSPTTLLVTIQSRSTAV